MTARVHVFGASGSGTTTLGRALADELGVPHLDSDDYYWLPTDPPFTAKRPPAARIARIERDMGGHADWVLSGSLCSWGDPLLHRFTLALFLTLAPAVRLERLAAREARRYGSRIAPGGDMHGAHLDFMAWAASYDSAGPPTRSLALHEAFSSRLPCPVLPLDGARPLADLVRAARDAIDVDSRETT
ncbi:MAG TPA: AAA family ATPase [Pseudomonadales bacterium]|nr:AAA family ATPase [Pseudomonadales bacterium]